MKAESINGQSYTTSFKVDQTPDEVFGAVLNVRGWWSQAIEGNTDRPGAEFKYRYRDVHRCTLRITQFVPGKKVVWHVVDNYFNFVKDSAEWTGTDVVFEIAENGGKTELQFTHVGLLPACECFSACSDGWNSYINGSLHGLITRGKGQPNPAEKVVAASGEAGHETKGTAT